MPTIQALIIDDNAKNVTVLARLLAEQGIATQQLTNPALLGAALQELETLNLVFVDLEMPGMDGFQVLQQIRANPRVGSAFAVAYTVHVSEIHVAHERGFDSFIGKPIDPDKFPEQVHRILRGEAVWETA